MVTSSTERLAEEADAAIRDSYHSLRIAQQKLDDLKAVMIQHPNGNPFKPAHDGTHGEFLDLFRRLEATRAELQEEYQVHTQPELQTSPKSLPRPSTPVADGRTATKVGGGGAHKRGRPKPYVLVPVSTTPLHLLLSP